MWKSNQLTSQKEKIMENKPSMSRVERLHREKVTRYSIRKYSFGAASVAVAALFMFLGNGAVSVQADQIQPGDTAAAQPATPTLDKTQLESYISEIETKLSNGSYDNKTEESVAVLKADLEAAKATLANATTQAELKQAYSKLVTTVNSKLKNKPVEKKETPAVDTTEGKETVGKKAENTEKKSESNSIENTGSNDTRNGKELDKNNAFRAETDTERPKVSIDYDDPASKTIWVTPTEETNITGRIKITDNSGKIVKGWMQKMGSGTETDIGYGLHNSNIDREATATADQPATLSVTGTLDARLNGKPWKNGSTVVSRKVRAKDASNNEMDNEGASDPDAQVWFKVRSQNVKYTEDLANKAANFDKVAVADTAQLQQAELDKIKAKLQEGDGNNLNGKIATVTQSGDKVVITYNDGTTAERPVTDFARVNAAPTVEIPYSVEGKKDVYVYANEDFDIPIKFKDDNGKVASATVKRGGNIDLKPKDPSNPDILDNEFGMTLETISTETPATAENPAIVHIKGNLTKETPGLAANKFPTDADGEYSIVTRYATATDTDGAFIENTATSKSYATDPGSFTVKLKAQTAKYDIKTPETKVPVVDANNVTEAEFNEIKKNIKIQYSTENPDKNLADKKGTEVENQDDRIESITKDGNNVVVTYKDGSKDTKPLTDFARTNPAPTVELPYSNVNKRQIYVYTGENTDLTFTGKDDTAVKNLYLRGPGDVTWANAKDYGFKIGAVSDSAVSEGEGTVSADKRTATIKMTGVTTLKAPNQWTSFIEAKDSDDAKSMTGADYNATTDDAARQQKPGYVQFVVKNQTSKYDIAAPTEKVAVTDPANVTEAELEKIKEKLQIEYSNNNDDANLADKKGKTVDAEDAKTKIASVTKDAKGNLVVTYTDGSKDTRPLSEFVTLDKQPAIDEVNKAAEKQIDAINKTPNATDEEKQAAIDKVNADKKKALDEIAKPEVTTKDALDKAQNAGTDAIAKDNPVVAKKDEAKQAIDDALTAKNKEIDDRTDLTPEEKTKAKEVAKAQADVAKAAVDNATTNAAVDKAKADGTKAVANVTPVAKAEAKKAIAKALEDKNSEIDKRTDLTDEEKTAAKNEAKDKADAQLAKINEQPDAAATPTAAKTAQDAVDAAKKTGVDEVTAVNPVAVKKPAAKKAIDDALKAKEAAIDARPDLTDDEKKAAKDAAKAAADKAKAAVDAATTDAAVDAAKGTGTGDIAKVNPVAKEAAKKAVADELAKKEAAIDARPDLTDEEKDAAKKDAQAKAKEATDAINAQPSNAETPEAAKAAQDAVDAAKKTGVDEVAAVNPEAKSKPAAKKAIDDKLAEQLKEIANTPDATDDEKKVAADAAKALADQAKEEIDKAGTDAEVKQLQDAAEGEIEKSVPVVEDKPNARKAIDEEATAKKAAIDARDDLTPKAKEDLKAEVDAIADQAKKAVDKATSATDVDKIEEADKAAIKAVGEVKEPVNKTLVQDPTKLTDAEKATLLEEVKKVNPTAKEVKYNEDGNIEVTTENGDKGTINPADIVKTADDLDNGKGGNDINKPLDKVVVTDPANLTDAEKAKLVDEVKAVNPGSVVTIDDKGTVTVSTPDGETAAIPATELVRTKEDTTKPDAGNSEIVKPADKVVGEPTDPAAQAKVEEKLKELNPEAKSVKFDDKGNATVTLNDGTTATIPAKDLFKSPEEAAQPNAGNDIVKPADKAVVANPEKLTDAEKKAIEDKVKAVNPDATVVVDDKGNATVTTPEGKTAVIPATDLTKSPEDAAKPNAGNDIVKPAAKTEVKDPANLTPEEKKAIEDKVKAVNPDATVVVDDKGNATVTTPEGKTAVIPATDLTKSPEDAAKPEAGNNVNTPADKAVVKDPAKLTPEEKKAIEDKVKAVNPDATVVVDDKGNATVTPKDGEPAVIPAADLTKSPEDAAKPEAGNDIVKPADKTAVKDPAKLTDAEKKAIEDKVKAVNPDATVVVDDKGNATVTTPEGKTAVIPAEDLTKDPAAATKPNAGNDIVKPADKTVVANPAKLTDAEKKAIEDKVKAVNPDATVVVDDKGNATVTTPEGKTAVIPAADLTKSSDAEKAPKAGNDIVKPASKTKVANPDALTLEEKKAIADKVSAVNPGSTVVVDDKGNATVTLPNGKIAVIPASDLTKSEKDVNDGKAKDNAVTPASKTKVANPEKLTDAEKKAIADKVKAANPGAEVVVDDKGNATVVKDGNVSVIPSTDLVKVQDDATKPNGGNDANTPAAKTVVKDPAELQDVEKKAIEDKVSAVNPGSTVVVDDQGNATVTKGDGTVLNIPASDLVIPAEKLADEATNAKVKTPAIRTLVGNKDSLTDTEKAAVKKSIEAVNPGATVVVDDKGNATVTMPDGSTATISKEQLVKDKDAVSKSKHGGDNLDIDLSKVEVADLANITPEEKAKFQYQVLGAITDVPEFDLDAFLKETDDNGNTVYTSKDGKVKITIDKDGNATATVEKDGKTEAAVKIDKDGNVTIVTKEGQVLAIPRDDAFKQRPYVPSNGGGNNGATNTDAKVDKAKLEGAIHQLDELIIKESTKLDAETAKEANDLLADAKKVFANADASQAEVDAMVKRLEEFKLNQASVATDDQAANNAINASNGETSEDVTDAKLAANVSKRNNQKELPNTGTGEEFVIFGAAAASILAGLGVAIPGKKKEDE